MPATSLEPRPWLEPLLVLLCHPRIPKDTASHQELSGENVHSSMNVLLLLVQCQEDPGTGGGAQKGQVRILKPHPSIEHNKPLERTLFPAISGSFPPSPNH